MTQLIITLGSFGLIPILIKKRFKLSYSILIVTMIISILSGLGVMGLADTALGVILNKYSRDTVLTVVMVGILGNLLKHYGILQRIVDSMLALIRSKKLIMMLMPALIGIMSVPGGAVLSAPFINNIGEELEIIPARRAAINLIFRHISMFLVPFSTTMLFIRASLPGINIYKLIGLGIPFVAGVSFLGYMIYMRGKGNGEKTQSKVTPERVGRLLVLSSPIYMSVVINVITGLPFFLSMVGSIIIVYILSDKKDFLYKAYRSINYNTILMVISILILKDVILQMDDMLLLIGNLLMGVQGGLGILVIFTLVSFFFGYITGYPTSSLAITLPILSMMGLGDNALHIYGFFLMTMSFAGYYYSPLHLCQVLTIGEMKVTTGELYKEYKLYFALQLLWIFALTLFMMALFG